MEVKRTDTKTEQRASCLSLSPSLSLSLSFAVCYLCFLCVHSLLDRERDQLPSLRGDPAGGRRA